MDTQTQPGRGESGDPNHWQKDSLFLHWDGSADGLEGGIWWPCVSPLRENLPSGPPVHKKGDKGGRQSEAGDGTERV